MELKCSLETRTSKEGKLYAAVSEMIDAEYLLNGNYHIQNNYHYHKQLI